VAKERTTPKKVNLIFEIKTQIEIKKKQTKNVNFSFRKLHFIGSDMGTYVDDIMDRRMK
jgi:hypothetical protein